MHWALSIPSFQALGQENSVSLVKAYWNELFTLGLAQCWQVMNVATILATFVNCLHSSLQQGKKHLYLFPFAGYKRGMSVLESVMIKVRHLMIIL